jgi:integrase
MAVLRRVEARKINDVAFFGQKPGRTLSNMAVSMILRRMGREDLTAHGYRSTIRDWAAQRTGVAPEVAEAALAHVVANRVEAAYRRSDLFEKRWVLMQQWGAHCDQHRDDGSAKVVPLRG